MFLVAVCLEIKFRLKCNAYMGLQESSFKLIKGESSKKTYTRRYYDMLIAN